MNNTIKEDALQIMRAAFDTMLPDAAVRRALKTPAGREWKDKLLLRLPVAPVSAESVLFHCT